MPPQAGTIRVHLARIVGSRHFASSPRLKKFLCFVVERTLDGNAADIKESVIGLEVFERNASYDPRIDPVVRVMAGRVRERLQQYYDTDGKLDEIRIELPKGAYVPHFERNRQQPAAPPVEMAVATSPWRRYLPVTFIALAAFAGLGLAISRRAHAPVQFQTEVLTTLPGQERSPSLSPDGNLVAFSWPGRKDGPPDIWIKAVKGEALRQLTATPVPELYPVWSPDGREIAFARPGQGVFVVSQLGGIERKISDTGILPAWSPDNKSILIRDRQGAAPFGIWQIDLDTLQKRRITQPSSGIGDWTFAVSPDGSMLAFGRCTRTGMGDLYVVRMTGGEPRRLTDWNMLPGGIAWTPDGLEILYDVRDQLWRIPVRGVRPGTGIRIPLPSTGMGRQFSLSRPGSGRPVRMAFEASYLDISLRLVDLDSPLSDGAFTVVRPLADATLPDFPGRFSPDGKRIAFASTRTGDSLMSLWTVGIDDNQLRHLKAAGGEEVRVGSWSPDGREIAFDGAEKSNLDIYVIREDGASRRRLTTTESADWQPWWSANGRWIYFTSDRTGRYEVWRMGVDGNDLRQITHTGGFEPMESPDGRYLYYLEIESPGSGLSRLMRIPTEGADSEFVIDDVRQRLWQVTQKGILFVGLTGSKLKVNLFRFDERRVVELGILPFMLGGGGEFARMAASSDGRWLLTSTRERDDFDLMLIDNFR